MFYLKLFLFLVVFPSLAYYYFFKKKWQYNLSCPKCSNKCYFSYRIRDGIKDNTRFYVINCSKCQKSLLIQNNSLIQGSVPSFTVKKEISFSEVKNYTVLKERK